MLDLYLNTEDKDNPLFILIKVFSFFSVLLLGKMGDEWAARGFFLRASRGKNGGG